VRQSTFAQAVRWKKLKPLCDGSRRSQSGSRMGSTILTSACDETSALGGKSRCARTADAWCILFLVNPYGNRGQTRELPSQSNRGRTARALRCRRFAKHGLFDCSEHDIGFDWPKLRKHRQRYQVAGDPFGNRERPRYIPERLVGLLEMDWHRMMNSALHSFFAQYLQHLVAISNPNGIHVIDMLRIRRNERRNDFIQVSKTPLIFPGVTLAEGIIVIEIL